MPITDVTMHDIYMARKKIAPIARRTPLISSSLLSELVGASVYLKLESLQETGSFKIRGAANKMLSLTPEEKKRGAVTVSTGNHGRAVAYVARRLGINAVICLSQAVPSNKVEALERLGAEVVIHGKSYDEAAEHCSMLEKERGLTFVNPFDDPFIIAGQGTIGLELLEDLPAIDTAVVPLSGGGLMSGIALALKSANPAIKTIGVTMDRGPAMYLSLRAGKIVDIVEEETIADSLVGGLGPVNNYTLRMCQKYVDDAVLVSDEEIAEAMAFALEKHHLVVEGGGAVGIAALLHGRAKGLGKNIAVVISGGNVDIPLLMKIAHNHIKS